MLNLRVQWNVAPCTVHWGSIIHNIGVAVRPSSSQLRRVPFLFVWSFNSTAAIFSTRSSLESFSWFTGKLGCEYWVGRVRDLLLLTRRGGGFPGQSAYKGCNVTLISDFITPLITLRGNYWKGRWMRRDNKRKKKRRDRIFIRGRYNKKKQTFR